MKLEYVRLLVSRFDDCFRFYRDVMGFQVKWGKEGWSYASFDTGENITLSLFNRHAMAEAVGTAHLAAEAISQDRVALIFGVENLDVAISQLQKQGAHFITSPKNYPDWGIRAAHLRDPDGNLIEIFSSMPTSEWTEQLRKDDSMFSKT